ncbi:MAG: transposase domain-containing protein [Polaromonas sp.]
MNFPSTSNFCQRVAAALSLIQGAKLNGHDPYAYLIW